jgi:aryl-alcohol dehydrogenase-like predicted oxidoreductase
MERRSFLKLVGGAGMGLALGGCATPVPVREVVAGMPYRSLGRTGRKVSVVAYGGLALTHGTQEEGTASLHRAFDQAVNYFDVAPAYGNGEAETKMGIGLQGLDRSRYLLACKTKKRDAAGAREELERSLTRLKTDHFDVYQFHCFIRPAEVDQVCGPGGALETVLKARDEGKVRAIGFSAHTTKAALRALESFRFDTVMFPINYVEYFTRGFGREVLAAAQQQDLPVLAIKAMSAGAWPKDAKKERNWWYRSLEEQAEIDLAYRWTLSLPGVVMGYSPSWLDLQDKAIAAGRAYRPATDADAAQMEQMAQNTGSLFKREEDSLARGNQDEFFYADYDHGHVPPSLA